MLVRANLFHAGSILWPSASGESYLRRGCARVTFYALAVSSQFTRECRLKKKLSKIRCDSQARHEILWLGHHGPLKEREPTRRDMSTHGYTRTFEASVSIYILALALSRVLSVRVYRRHQSFKFGIKNNNTWCLSLEIRISALSP